LTEGWFEENMFCPDCPSPFLTRAKDNTQVIDFRCENCGAEYQLKSKEGTIGKKLRDAAYGPMITRILANKAPHFAILNYENSSQSVRNLLLVPGHFFTPSIVESVLLCLQKHVERDGWGATSALTYCQTMGRFSSFSVAPFENRGTCGTSGLDSAGWKGNGFCLVDGR